VAATPSAARAASTYANRRAGDQRRLPAAPARRTVNAKYTPPSRGPVLPAHGAPVRTSALANVRPNGNAAAIEVARWVGQEDHLFRPASAARRWQYIVLHHSAAELGCLASIDRYHRETKGWDECGYHFVIGNGSESGDGEIEVGGRWRQQKHGAHTKHPDHVEYNEAGIGICLVGDCDRQPPSAKQVAAARALVAYLQEQYGVSSNRVTTHGDLVGNRTECPGSHFPFEQIVPRAQRFAQR
jgi:N-acetyl-anhydromuramyl-L-alanine amidase AmpD